MFFNLNTLLKTYSLPTAIFLFVSDMFITKAMKYFFESNKKCTPQPFENYVLSTCDFDRGDNVKYRKHIRTIIELVDKAQRSIHVAMYLFTIRDFSSALIRAAQRGVLVRVVLDGTMVNCMGSQKPRLAEAGIEVRCNNDLNFLIHHKFCIIDSEFHTFLDYFRIRNLPRDGIVITGSQNWTRQATAGNWEYTIVSANPQLVQTYTYEFLRVWNLFNTTPVV
uniref:Mitochondrial cardiolipin hydrolase n=1 Tax=Xenopsylla cheopis TaxID=163159 RepID=A0A6M2DXL2_XENCH